MPAISQAQFRFMQAIKHGSLKKRGLSKEKASEFIEETPEPKKLPAKKIAAKIKGK